jgi:hypothetical protein
MSRLYLKTNIKQLLLVGALLIFSNRICSADNIPDLIFKEHLAKADAYLLYSYTDVSYGKSWLSFKRNTTVNSKLVINTRPGVEKYAFITLNEFTFDHLITIAVHTLKADGSVLELDTNLVYKQKSNLAQQGQIKLPIPGVEPGDTIEIYYSYSETPKENEPGNFVSLHNELPSLITEYSISAPPHLLIRYKQYNDFPEPGIMVSDTMIYCLFKMENIKGISDNPYSCSFCELPYIYYSVFDKNKEAKTWKEIYNREFNVITQPMLLDRRNSSHYKRWKKRVLRNAGDVSKYQAFELLIEDINNNFRIELPIGDELARSSGYFIKQKRFDPISIRRLYRQILEDQDIDYWAVFGRSRKLGNIDPYFIRNQEFDHIFFAYENSNGSLSTIYPNDIFYHYQIGEIPTSLYNTEAVIAKPYRTGSIKRKDRFIKNDFKLAEADSVITSIIKLSGMESNLNIIRQIYYCDVDLNEKSTSFKSVLSVSGGLSTEIRKFFGLLYHNKEASDFYEAFAEFEGKDISLKIDTILNSELKKQRPFVYTINAAGSVQSGISFVNDSIVSITLVDLIQQTHVESDADSLDLDYYMDYTYTDVFTLVIRFPCSIELVGNDNYNKEIKNEYGEYRFNMNSFNNNLSIHSTYSIVSEVIPKEGYPQLKQLNDLMKEVNNLRILVKLKDI